MPPRIWHKNDPNKPEGAVYVGRPSVYGNLYTLKNGSLDERRRIVELYRQHLHSKWGRRVLELAKTELKGKDLVCWCRPGQPCHAEVLLEVANDEGNPAGESHGGCE